MLHNVVEGVGPRVVLVHGFTQTLRSWDALAGGLIPGHEVVRVDLPGHGGSAGARLGFEAAAMALGDAAGRATYVGYSMGGRLCLRLALDRPDLVAALVVLGASPGIRDPAEREDRREEDERLAARIEARGVDAFVEEWLARPLFATLSRGAAGVEDRRANSAAGLAAALGLLGPGVQQPLWDRLADLRVPTLLVAGERDAKFVALAEEMAGCVGGPARVSLVAGAGHAVHLERPDAFLALVQAFLAEHQAAR